MTTLTHTMTRHGSHGSGFPTTLEVNNGRAALTVGIREGSNATLAAYVLLYPDDARKLAADLVARADEIDPPELVPMTGADVAEALDAYLMRVAEATMTPADFVDYVVSVVGTIRARQP